MARRDRRGLGTRDRSARADRCPVPEAAYPSFTRDGRKLVLAGAFGTDSIQRIAFDAARAVTVGEPRTVFASSMRLFYVGASADGSRVAFTSGGRREDLYLIGADGSGLRQLTNDAFKDRGPVFHPDGKRLVIYSTRSGQYEAWSMHFDGSGATQLTRTEGDETIEPEISPDGRQLTSMLSRYPGSAIARLDGPAPATVEQIPNPEAGGFEDPAWSSDGSRLAGMVRTPAGRMALALYTLATRKHEVLPVDGEDPTWLTGDRSLLFLRSGSSGRSTSPPAATMWF